MPTPDPVRRVTARVHGDAGAGIALIVASIAALVWANVAPASYHDLWHTTLSLPGPDQALTLEAWVNDGLMAIFFFVVGLEIKRELVAGELRDPRAAMVPIAAALGGMIVPAALFALITIGSGLGNGWGIPMATDIAFAVGVLRLVAPRAPSALGVTLLTLAIVDDVGAILVIAVFYSAGISFGWLLAALALLVVIRVAGRTLAHPLWYLAPAVVLWVEMLRSGVHATLAGVVLGLATPLVARNGRPVLTTLEHTLQPWSNLVVLPLFALANVGIPLSAATVRDAATNPAAIGIVVGLLVGKFVGINLGVRVAERLGGRRPDDLSGRALVALGLLGGIGLTVSLFIAGLSYAGLDLDAAKLAILVASTVAALAATGVLRTIRPVPDAPA
jgi:NhaA family Na+:H+ antiporter